MQAHDRVCLTTSEEQLEALIDKVVKALLPQQRWYNTLQNTPQHSAAHCNTLQRTATRCTTSQHTATHCHLRPLWTSFCRRSCSQQRWCNTLQHAATRCNTLYPEAQMDALLQALLLTKVLVHHTAVHGNKLQHAPTRCNTLQRMATRCKTLQQAQAHCNTLQPEALMNELL